MSHLAGEGQSEDGRLGFDRRVRLEFHGSKISSGGGLLVFRELDGACSVFHEMMGKNVVDTCIGHNRLHSIVALSRQSVFGRLAGYEDVNDADFLAFDPVMRQIVGGRAVEASSGVCQSDRAVRPRCLLLQNLAALGDARGRWIRPVIMKPSHRVTKDRAAMEPGGARDASSALALYPASGPVLGQPRATWGMSV